MSTPASTKNILWIGITPHCSPKISQDWQGPYLTNCNIVEGLLLERQYRRDKNEKDTALTLMSLHFEINKRIQIILLNYSDLVYIRARNRINFKSIEHNLESIEYGLY